MAYTQSLSKLRQRLLPHWFEQTLPWAETYALTPGVSGTIKEKIGVVPLIGATKPIAEQVPIAV
jgi:hypothetical protein